MSLKIKFGDAVYYARTELGLTQEELAEIVGRTPRTIQNIEYGLFLPKADAALALIHTLQLDPKDFAPDIEREIPDHLLKKLRQNQEK